MEKQKVGVVHFSRSSETCNAKENNNNNCKVTCLMACLLLYRPKIHRIFVNFSFFWHWVSLFLFSSIEIFNATYDKNHKKEKRQMFRPHMGALFSDIDLKINSKFSWKTKMYKIVKIRIIMKLKNLSHRLQFKMKKSSKQKHEMEILCRNHCT